MTGKLKTKGNMMLAMKLDGVLKVSCRLQPAVILRWRTHTRLSQAAKGVKAKL